MESFYETQSILIGLIGWAATYLATNYSDRLNDTDRRMMVVCSWMFWMSLGFGGLVLQGVLDVNAAAFVVGFSTMIIAMVVMIGSRRRHPRTRP